MDSKPAVAMITAQSVLVIGLAAALIWSIKQRVPSQGAAALEPRPVAERGELASEEANRIELYRTAAPSVVHVKAATQFRTRKGRAVKRDDGGGSGVVWDTAGHIVTNFHNIDGSNAVDVVFEDGTSYAARVVGKYVAKDLAVLKIEARANRLTPVRVGASDDLEVGQSVLAVGNPYHLAQTLTTGVISGLGREIESATGVPILDVIQTDAAINPGNSGGPLFDTSGRMVGINTVIMSSSGASAGIGFAIPIGTVNRVVPQLIRDGKVTKPTLGVTIVPPSSARRYGLRGLVVMHAHPGLPAAQSGILGTRRNEDGVAVLGDAIIAIDGVQMRNLIDIYRVLDERRAGDEVTVEVERQGVRKSIVVKLGAR